MFLTAISLPWTCSKLKRKEKTTPINHVLITDPVMQYRRYASFERWALVLCKIAPTLWLGTGVCLLSSFFYSIPCKLRYLMTFWCMFFMRNLVWMLGTFRLISCLLKTQNTSRLHLELSWTCFKTSPIDTWSEVMVLNNDVAQSGIKLSTNLSLFELLCAL